MYDATTGYLVANPINRYEIASHTQRLRYGDDGSLTITISNAEPEETANWLPAPSGAFRITLRTYLPKAAILNQTWQLPALQQAV
jgi:hypothetical protein